METSLPKLQTFFFNEIIRKKTGKGDTIFQKKKAFLKKRGVKKGRQDALLNSEKFLRGKKIQS